MGEIDKTDSFNEANDTDSRADGGTVIVLPPGRDKLAADLKSIDRQCFLMASDLHWSVLVNLRDVPNRTLAAAENLLKPGEAAEYAGQWSRTLVLCVRALTDGRKHILAMTGSHDLKQPGRRAADAIDSIEAALPAFLLAVAQAPADPGEPPAAPKKLGAAIEKLDSILAGLLETIELRVAHAKGHKKNHKKFVPIYD